MSDSKQEAKKYLIEANGLYKKRFFIEALELFEKAKELDPTLFEVQFSIAKTHIRLGKPLESVRLFGEALQLAPEDKKAYYTLGFAGILYINNSFAAAYKVTKPLFNQKIKAQKLPELLKFPVQAIEYDDVVQILNQYTETEKSAILKSIASDTSVSKESYQGLQNHLSQIANNENWDVFDDDLELSEEKEIEKNDKKPTTNSTKKKKKSLAWLWILLVLGLLGAAAFFGKDYVLEYMDWQEAIKTDKVGTYKRYLRNYPSGEHATIAEEKIEGIARNEAVEYGTSEAIVDFMNAYPKSKLILSVPLKVANKQGLLKIRGYETLKEEYIFNAAATEEYIKIPEGCKVEIQYVNDSIIYKPIILTIDKDSEIKFGEEVVIELDDTTANPDEESIDDTSKDDDPNPAANPITISFVQTPPTHPNCTQTNQKAKMRCFEQKINKQIQSNLDIPGFQKIGLSKTSHKVPFYFVIDRNGVVTDVKVRAADPVIEANIKASILALPTFTAGIQDEKSVAVSYDNEIVFSTAKKEIPSKTTERKEEVKYDPIPVRIPQNLTIQMADRAPIYPGCEGNIGLPLVKCTSKKINNYISSTINHDNLKGHGLPPGKQHASISFRVTNQGRISSVSVTTNNTIIKKEITRTVNSLPYMSPALYEDTPAGINYRLTLDVDLSLEEQ